MHRWKEHAEAVGQMVDDFFEEGDVTTVTTGSAQMPVTLWINVESRSETLRHYQIAFARPKNGRSHVYFNFGIDKLEIPRHGDLKQIISREELAKLKTLILPRRILHVSWWRAKDGLKNTDREHLKASIPDLGIKLDQLHEASMSARLEPNDPDNPFVDAELRRLAEQMQQEIAQAYNLPQMLSLLCPNLGNVHFQPAATCRYWPGRGFRSFWDSLTFSRNRNKRDHICSSCLWDNTSAPGPGAPIPLEQLALHHGGTHMSELDGDCEMRMGRVTVTWHASRASAASDTEVEGGINGAVVANWNHFASDMMCRLTNFDFEEMLFEI